MKKLVQGGSAEKDGRLQPGDEILSVDSKNLNGLTQERFVDVELLYIISYVCTNVTMYVRTYMSVPFCLCYLIRTVYCVPSVQSCPNTQEHWEKYHTDRW